MASSSPCGVIEVAKLRVAPSAKLATVIKGHDFISSAPLLIPTTYTELRTVTGARTGIAWQVAVSGTQVRVTETHLPKLSLRGVPPATRVPKSYGATLTRIFTLKVCCSHRLYPPAFLSIGVPAHAPASPSSPVSSAGSRRRAPVSIRHLWELLSAGLRGGRTRDREARAGL